MSHLDILGNLTNQRVFSYKVDLVFMTHDHELKVIFFPCTEFELIVCKLQIFLRQNKCITISLLSLLYNKTFYLWFTARAVFISKSLRNIMIILLSCLFYNVSYREWYGTHIYWFIMCNFMHMNLQFSTFYQKYIEKEPH